VSQDLKHSVWERRIILEWMFKTRDVRVWSGLIWLGFCDSGHEIYLLFEILACSSQAALCSVALRII